jgi:hypothetical protein
MTEFERLLIETLREAMGQRDESIYRRIIELEKAIEIQTKINNHLMDGLAKVKELDNTLNQRIDKLEEKIKEHAE